ncbi:MAG: T9SS type A sorting domain-containing protein [Flammeovirgaceae bacterium]|nr:MAG: T9SS type A sorting domain-containing protein [Flammeovirgaceae bacterium]
MRLTDIRLILAIPLLITSAIGPVLSQTCTISGSGTINWVNASPPTCIEGGTAGSASIIVVPVGVTLNFDSNPDTWTGTRIEVLGTLRISAPGQVTINSNIVVKNGGLLSIDSKLNLGSTSGCGYTLIVETGGTVDITGGTPDRLNICGVEIARGGGAGCNPYPAGPLPYCEPGGGFTGPTGFDENGYNPTLPVTLLYFIAESSGNQIVLTWATEKEEGFDKFVIQRAVGNLSFKDLGEIRGAGYDTHSLREYEFTDDHPLLGTNYYRLKAVDLDGSFEYFGPVSVVYQGERILWVTPNPASGERVILHMNFSPADGDRIQFFNQVGALLKDVSASRVNGEIQFEQPLIPGVYLIRYNAATFTQVVRFVVAR